MGQIAMNQQLKPGSYRSWSAPPRADAKFGSGQTVVDTAHVDIDDRHSRAFWSVSIGITESQLLRAMREVGSAVVDIERFFSHKRVRR